jgi:2-C-methyl-D-erythritol 2,4-cyclodiphosphate synthase
MMPRVGIGYDVHRFSGGRPLVLGGVRIAHTHGLVGHSDADALCHAVADALLGALALGDLGAHFPDTDPRWAGVSSLDLLARVVALVGGKGHTVGNVDATVLAAVPMLAPHVPAMRESLAGALGVPANRVSVKATRPEGLGSLAHGEGLAVWAVALVVPIDPTELK